MGPWRAMLIFWHPSQKGVIPFTCTHHAWPGKVDLQESGYPKWASCTLFKSRSLPQQQKVLGIREKRWRTVVSCWANTGFSLLIAVAAAEQPRSEHEVQVPV